MSTILQREKAPTRPRALGIALFFGTLAALATYFWLNHQATQNAGTHPAATVSTVVAVQDIPARTTITQAMLEVRRVAPGQVPADAATAISDLVGKVATAPISAGSPLTNGLIVTRGIEMGLAYTMPNLHRAMTIALDPVSAVAGFVKPGDHVDVLATFNIGNRQSVTRLVLQNVTVLATGSQSLSSRPPDNSAGTAQEGSQDSSALSNATLMVSPDQAQTLALAIARGKMQLLLRPADDTSVSTPTPMPSAAVTGVNPLSLPFPTEPALPVTPKPEPHSIEAPPLPARPQPLATLPVARPAAKPQQSRLIQLDGVIVGADGFASLSEGDTTYYRRIGDRVGDFTIRSLSEEGVLLQKAQRPPLRWAIGQKFNFVVSSSPRAQTSEATHEANQHPESSKE